MRIWVPLLNKTLSRSSLFRSICFSATPLATLLLTVSLPSPPAAAIHTNRGDYQLCARELLRLRISPEVAADSCAAALYPKDLTTCVYKINQRTNIAAVDALNTCRQVRKPRELANCAINISVGTQGAEGGDVLDNCRRSLLPVRFAECVVGLNREIDISAAQAMATCIDGSDRPRDFYPPVLVPQPVELAPPGSLTLPSNPELR